MDRSITSLNSSTTGGIATGPAVVVNGIPVNLYRGIASPTVAVASLASCELATSVALAYDGQGVRVNSVASEVGTGWNLIAGGEIVCDVRDEPDQNRGRPLDWLRILQTKPAGNGLERDYQEYVCRDGAKEYDDTEHDIFRLSVNGLSAEFILKDGWPYVLDNPSLTIHPTFAPGSPTHVLSFTIIDDSGNQYLFTESESTTITTTSLRLDITHTAPVHTVSYTSRWVLTKIQSPNDDEITFSYVSGSYQSREYVSYTAYTELKINNSPVSIPPADCRNTTKVVVASPKVLYRIQARTGRIEFERSLWRRYADGAALTGVTTYNVEGRAVARVKLVYSYFISPGVTPVTEDDCRLRLDRVVRLADGCAVDNTRFLYQQSGSVSRGLSRQDYHGFYNNNSTGTLLPPVPGEPQLVSGDRSSHLPSMLNCALTRIEYGTGGYHTLEYELHLAPGSDPSLAGPGLRIRQINLHNTDGSSISEQIGYTMAVVPPVPKCFDMRKIYLLRPFHDPCCDANYNVVDICFRSTEALEMRADDLYGYRETSVEHPNGSHTEHTFTSTLEYPDAYNTNSTKFQVFVENRCNRYGCHHCGGCDDDNNPCFGGMYPPFDVVSGTFSDPRSHASRGMYPGLSPDERPYGVKDDKSVFRGVLVKQQEVMPDGVTLVRKVESHYDFPTFSTGNEAVSARIGIEHDNSGGGYTLYNYYYNIKFYKHYQAYSRLGSQVVTTYDQNTPAFPSANGSLITTTAYEYPPATDKDGHLPYKIISSSSLDPGLFTVQQLTRTLGHTPNNGTFTAILEQRNMLTTVTHEKRFTTRNPAGGMPPFISSTRAEYAIRGNNHLVPVRTFRYTMTPTGFGEVVTFDATRYDSEGNLLSSVGADGIPQSRVLGYDRTLPIASVTNAITSDGLTIEPANAGHTSFEFGGNSDEWSAAATYSPDAKTGVRSVLLSNPAAEYGPGKTFTLAPEQQTGKLLFSCWAKAPAGATAAATFVVVMVLKNTLGQDVLWTGTPFSAEPNGK